MRVLITGATGFIGRSLCRHWLDAGHQIFALTRNLLRANQLLGNGVTAVTSFDQIAGDVAFDAAVNLAGAPTFGALWSDARKKVLRESRIGVTRELIDIVRRTAHPPPVLVSASAIGYYGDRGDQILTESTPGYGGFAHQLCADWEAEAWRAQELGVRVCVLRIGLVVGRGGGFLSPMLLPFRLGLGGVMGNGKQWMSWVHLNDLLDVISHLVGKSTESGVFNAVAPAPVTNREFTEALAHVLHRPAVLATPGWMLKTALGEMGALLLSSQRVLPERLLADHFRFQYGSIEDALQAAVR